MKRPRLIIITAALTLVVPVLWFVRPARCGELRLPATSCHQFHFGEEGRWVDVLSLEETIAVYQGYLEEVLCPSGEIRPGVNRSLFQEYFPGNKLICISQILTDYYELNANLTNLVEIFGEPIHLHQVRDDYYVSTYRGLDGDRIECYEYRDFYLWSIVPLKWHPWDRTQSVMITPRSAALDKYLHKNVFDPAKAGRPADAIPEIRRLEPGYLGSGNNPVRCEGPGGEKAYLNRLRCSDGTRPRYYRVGSVSSDPPNPYGNILDLYRVRCGKTVVEVYMDMYHEGYVEAEPVPGFTIIKPSDSSNGECDTMGQGSRPMEP